jgi:hypothetical protein
MCLQDYASTIFVAKLLEWPTVNSSLGQVIKTLGENFVFTSHGVPLPFNSRTENDLNS